MEEVTKKKPTAMTTPNTTNSIYFEATPELISKRKAFFDLISPHIHSKHISEFLPPLQPVCVIYENRFIITKVMGFRPREIQDGVFDIIVENNADLYKVSKKDTFYPVVCCRLFEPYDKVGFRIRHLLVWPV